MKSANAEETIAAVKIPRRAMSRRCRCGVCTMCVDNARWERVFQAKFADPGYYAARPVRQGSSLDWLQRGGV